MLRSLHVAVVVPDEQPAKHAQRTSVPPLLGEPCSFVDAVEGLARVLDGSLALCPASNSAATLTSEPGSSHSDSSIRIAQEHEPLARVSLRDPIEDA
ncbi:MAG: hypothetical protein U0263_31255 [Polyangiaceae bacterium]